MFPFVCALRLCEMLLPLHNLLATLGFLFRIYTTYTVYQSVPNSWSQSKSDQIIKFFSFLQCIYTFRYITIDCRVTVLCFRLRVSLSVCDCHPPCLLLPAVRTDKMPGEWRDAYLARTGSAQQISYYKNITNARTKPQSVAFLYLCVALFRSFDSESKQVREDNEHLRHDNFQATATAVIEDVWTRPQTLLNRIVKTGWSDWAELKWGSKLSSADQCCGLMGHQIDGYCLSCVLPQSSLSNFLGAVQLLFCLHFTYLRPVVCIYLIAAKCIICLTLHTSFITVCFPFRLLYQGSVF